MAQATVHTAAQFLPPELTTRSLSSVSTAGRNDGSVKCVHGQPSR